MKRSRFFSSKKPQAITNWLLHLHGSSGSQTIMFPSYPCRSTGNSGNFRSSPSVFSYYYATMSSRHLKSSQVDNKRCKQNRMFNEAEGNKNATKKIDLRIISRESIKPASPTPNHSKDFKLSILDQIFPNIYTPLALFIPNTNDASIDDVVTKRSKHLKDSLSELLTRYYPFAGEIKDDFHIECNDKGVHFVEARVNQTIKDFLHQPDDKKVRELIPEHPTDIEPSSANYVVSVQVNIFNCGGIALCTKLSHKIIDGTTAFAFLKAWADAAKGVPKKIMPSFVASEILPSNPSLKRSLPSKMFVSKKYATKRFVFDSTTLSSLKNQLAPAAASPTRMEVTTAVIWKAAAKAASVVRPFGPQSPHVTLNLVEIRRRVFPLLPNEAVGNLFVSGVGVCRPHNTPDLANLLAQIQESKASVNQELVEAAKGVNVHQKIDWNLRDLNDLFEPMDEGDGLTVTSLLNSGMYEIDFGWGKPIWFYHMNPGISRVLALTDMIKVGGVEAIVTLSREEMEIFERDPEILSYTSMNPSPLQFLN